MDIDEYTVTRKQIGILLGCIGLVLVVGYFAVPAAQAGVHSITDSSETTYQSENKFAYSSFVITSTSDHDGYPSYKLHYNETKLYANMTGLTSIYTVDSADGYVETVYMQSEHSKGFETISQKGQSIQYDGANITYSTAIIGSGGYGEDSLIYNTLYDAKIELEGAKYEQTGEKTYHNRSVDVYKKTWTSMGIPTVFNDDTIYVDSKTGMILYMDVKMNDASQNKQFDLKSVEYSVKPTEKPVPTPDWITDVTVYPINDSTQIRAVLGPDTPRDSSASIAKMSLDFDPQPIDVNSEVTVTTKKNGEQIGSNKTTASVLRSDFYVKSTGEIVSTYTKNSDEINSEEYVTFTKNDTITLIIESDDNSKILNLKDSNRYSRETGIATEQPYFNNTITSNESKINYQIHDAYQPGNITIQYGNQQKQPTEKTLYQYPKPENSSLVFNNTSQVTHFSIIPAEITSEKNIILESISGETTQTGTIQFDTSTQRKATNTNITLKQNKEKIAQMETTRETRYISNVPVGKTEIIIETDDDVLNKSVTVKENENIYVEFQDVAATNNSTEKDSPNLAHDAGMRPETYFEESKQAFVSFTPEELNFSNETMNRTNYTVQDQESAKPEDADGRQELPEDMPVDKTFDIDTTITQSEGTTQITINSITNASRNETIDERRGLVQVYYAGEKKEIEIEKSNVNKTVTFNSTNDSYVQLRYWQDSPTLMNWGSAIYLVNVEEPTEEKGWIYMKNLNENYRLYNDETEHLLTLSEESLYEIERGPIRINAPVDTYALIMEAEGVGTSYQTFPVTDKNRTTLYSTMLGQHLIEYDNNNPEVDSSPYSTVTSNESGNRTVTFKYISPDTNGTATIIYGNQTRTVDFQEHNTEEFSISLRDSNSRYLKLFYSPNHTTNITQFEIHRLYPEGQGIDNWYLSQNNGTIKVYDWATQVAEFEYTVMLETGPQSRYTPQVGLGYKSSETTRGHFRNTFEVELVDDSTESVENTTQTED